MKPSRHIVGLSPQNFGQPQLLGFAGLSLWFVSLGLELHTGACSFSGCVLHIGGGSAILKSQGWPHSHGSTRHFSENSVGTLLLEQISVWTPKQLDGAFL